MWRPVADGIITLALDTIQRVERTRTVRAFVGIETEKVRAGVPATITFAGKTLLDMREEIRVAETALARYSSFLGIAVHRYGSLPRHGAGAVNVLIVFRVLGTDRLGLLYRAPAKLLVHESPVKSGSLAEAAESNPRPGSNERAMARDLRSQADSRRIRSPYPQSLLESPGPLESTRHHPGDILETRP